MADGGTNDVVALVHQLALDRSNKDSIAPGIHAARENLRQIREQISVELWERINRLYWTVRRTAEDASWQDQPHQFLRGVIEDCHQFIGLTTATMNRGEGYTSRTGRSRTGHHYSASSTVTSGLPDCGPARSRRSWWRNGPPSCAPVPRSRLHPRFTARIDARASPTSCCSTRVPPPIRFAVEQVEAACAASRVCPGARTPAGPSGWPAACGRHSITRSSTSSSTTACRCS